MLFPLLDQDPFIYSDCCQSGSVFSDCRTQSHGIVNKLFTVIPLILFTTEVSLLSGSVAHMCEVSSRHMWNICVKFLHGTCGT